MEYFDEIPNELAMVQRLQLSADGKKVAYTLKTEETSYRETLSESITTTNSKTVLMVNEQQVSPVYFDIYDFNLSTDGKNIGYTFSQIRNNQEVYGINFNGRELATGYSHRPKYTYSRDGSKMIYWLQDDTGYHIMVNGEPKESLPAWLNEELKARPKPYTGNLDGVAPEEIFVVEKPSGMEFIYKITYFYNLFQRKSFFIKDGQKFLEQFTPLPFPDLKISPDGANIAGLVQAKSKYYMSLNGQIISPVYKGIYTEYDIFKITHQIAFSSDGKKLFYVMKDKKWFIMMNDQKVTEDFDNILSFGINADGSQIAYSAVKNGKTVLMVNDRVISSDFSKGEESHFICFSPDDTKVCYKLFLSGKDPKQCLMVGGQPITPPLSKLTYRLEADNRIYFAGVDTVSKEIVYGVAKPW